MGKTWRALSSKFLVFNEIRLGHVAETGGKRAGGSDVEPLAATVKKVTVPPCEIPRHRAVWGEKLGNVGEFDPNGAKRSD